MSSSVSHKLRVQLLYRRILKEQLNWKPQRDVWLQNALYTRMLFEQNKELKDAGDIEAAISDGTKWMETRRHPDPYTSHKHTTHTREERQRAEGGKKRTALCCERCADLLAVALLLGVCVCVCVCVCVLLCAAVCRSSHTMGWFFVPTQYGSSSLRHHTQTHGGRNTTRHLSQPHTQSAIVWSVTHRFT